MRRGLMAWDAAELPAEALRARVSRLQTAMAARGQDAIILYTNFIRSAAVSYLTAFSPYWADGILMVPSDGEPVFATTLSKRVGSWIETVKPIGGLINTPAPGAVLGKKLAEVNIRRLAILELDAFPAGLYDDLAAALPGVEIVDGTDSFGAVRCVTDEAEHRLMRHADEIAASALGCARGSELTAGEAVAAIERQARLQGAEEVYVAIAPDLDSDRRFVRLSGDAALGRHFAVRATVAYKGAWVRCAQTYSCDGKYRTIIAAVDEWFQTLLTSVNAATCPTGADIASHLTNLPNARLLSWIAESPLGTRPLALVATSAQPGVSPPQSSAIILTVALTIDGMPWCGAGLAKS